MAHVRTQIRNALAAAVTGLAATGARVYVSRVAPIPVDQLPALRVLTGSEAIQADSISAPAVLERTLTMLVEVHASAIADVDTAVDTACAQVEAAIGAAPTLGGLVGWCLPTSIEMEIDDDAEQPVARATMAFDCRYYTTQTAPETAI